MPLVRLLDFALLAFLVWWVWSQVIRGWRAAEANPGAAAATVAAANPSLSESIEETALRQTLPSARPANATTPFGYQYATQWTAFAAWMHQHGLLPGAAAANPGLAITNEFLPGQGEGG